MLLLDVGQPLSLVRSESTGEEDQRTYAGPVHRLDDSVGIPGGEGHRLVHQQMATLPGSPDSKLGLNLRRHGKGHSSDIGKHVIDVFIGLRADSVSQLSGAGERTSPHTDQVGVGMCGQCCRMSLLSPVSGPDDSEAHTRHPASRPCWSAISERNQLKLAFGVRCWVA